MKQGLRDRLNRFLFPLGLRLERLPRDYYGLADYPERTRPPEPRYLNIGALDFRHPLWHRLDNPTDWGSFATRQSGNVDVPHDLMSGQPLPLADGTLAVAYCSHVVEHLRDQDVQRLFRELHRTLQPGGTFRLVAPDARLFYQAYQRADARLFDSGLRLYPAPSLEMKLLMQFATALLPTHPGGDHPRATDEDVRRVLASTSMEDFFEHFARQVPPSVQERHPADHMNWFTPEKAETMLREAGFTDVRHSSHLQSHLPLLRHPEFFDPYPDHSLYAEVTR